MKSEFDNLLRQKIDEGELPYDPLQWQRMGSMLDAAEKKKRKAVIIPLLKGLAAGIALLIGIAGLNYYHTDKHTTIATQQDVPEKITALKTKTQPAATKKENVPAQQHYYKQANPAAEKTIAQNIVAKRPAKHNDQAEMTLAEQMNNNARLPKTLLAAYTGSKQESSINTGSEPPVKTATVVSKSIAQDVQKNISPVYEPDLLQEQKNYTGTSLSLAGGLNYGNLNAGYAVGINARRKLNRKIFLDGDVALVNNRSSFDVTYTTSDGFVTSSPGITPNVAASNKPRKETIANSFYYVQFTPSLGYALSPRMNLSLGADIQQRVNGNSGSGLQELAASSDGITAILPERDFGLMGKTEFAVTGRIKTGILYRAGVNNLVYEKSYLNRRYFQVQLKYQLFGK